MSASVENYSDGCVVNVFNTALWSVSMSDSSRMISFVPNTTKERKRHIHKSALIVGARTNTVLDRLQSTLLHCAAIFHLYCWYVGTRRYTAINHLFISFFKLSTTGSRAFPVAAAKIWNALLDNVVSASSINLFQHKLEIFLFSDLSVISTPVHFEVGFITWSPIKSYWLTDW